MFQILALIGFILIVALGIVVMYHLNRGLTQLPRYVSSKINNRKNHRHEEPIACGSAVRTLP